VPHKGSDVHGGHGISGLHCATNGSSGTSGTNGTTSTVSHLGLSCVSSRGTTNNAACTIGVGPSLPAESACTLQASPGSSFGLPIPGVPTLGSELEATIIQHAMQRVLAVFGTNQMPAALSAHMHTPNTGLLNPQLWQAQWAATAHMPLLHQGAMPTVYPEVPTEFLGSNSGV
jgi:hypothetical protein